MDKLKRVLTGNDSPDEESGIMDQFSDAATFSWSTRIKGFIACFVIGIAFSILGSFALFFHGGLRLFAAFYTLGNITSLFSTLFLMGPFNQIKKMFAATRALATCIVIISFILTLIAAFVLKNPVLALLLIIVQSLAMTWYSLSYIPYARDAVKKTLSTCIDV
ncbi:vesicle transport protein SFT2B [Harmonia axyridis]|uniref:vesicle transport protein SFT2B n=1 Tax=Harmonia axyridis TaxID=115357 RepID=UPI001E276B56|nr:vesicle transport protein SFT2B [Harmonia axyridis]XP_045477314.1 vesicle transport protein SFT2B [Harmonia axyridis]